MHGNPRTIAMLTIGQAPRVDVVPAMRRIIPDDVRIVEYGALDDLDLDAIKSYSASPEEVGIVTKLRDGTSVLLSHDRLLPAMQAKVDLALERENADVIVILCGADWSALNSPVLLVNPGTLFPSVIMTLARGRKLGIIKPSPGQIQKESERYLSHGIDAVVTAASPYSGDGRIDEARRAAGELRDAGCDLIWMTCVGMDESMRSVVRDITGAPVILAHALLARIVTELVGTGAPAKVVV